MGVQPIIPGENSAKLTQFAIKFYPWNWHWKYNEFLTHQNFLLCAFNRSLLTEIKQQARLAVARVSGSHTKRILVEHSIKAVSDVANLAPVRRLTLSVPDLRVSRNSHGRTCCLFAQASAPRSFVFIWKTQDQQWRHPPHHRPTQNTESSRDTHSVPQNGWRGSYKSDQNQLKLSFPVPGRHTVETSPKAMVNSLGLLYEFLGLSKGAKNKQWCISAHCHCLRFPSSNQMLSLETENEVGVRSEARKARGKPARWAREEGSVWRVRSRCTRVRTQETEEVNGVAREGRAGYRENGQLSRAV